MDLYLELEDLLIEYRDDLSLDIILEVGSKALRSTDHDVICDLLEEIELNRRLHPLKS